MTERPTVLVLHPSDEFYGADRSLLSMVRSMPDIVRPLVVLPSDLPYGGELSHTLRQNGIDVVVGPLPVVRRRYLRGLNVVRWGIGSIRGWMWMVRLARAEKARLVISNTSGILIGAPLARAIGASHAWYLREIVEHPRWFRTVIRGSARLAKGQIVAVSDAVARWVGSVPDHGPVVIRNGVDIPAEVEPLPDQPSAVFVGRLSDWKGQDVFVSAALISHQTRPSARYRIVGGAVPGDDGAARELSRRLQVVDPTGSFITWDGPLADPRSAMRAAWVVVVPSLRPDPFPNVVLEAMSEGRMIVGSATGGIPEMVTDGITGVLCPPGDAHALAAAISMALGDKGLAERAGMAGRFKAAEEFSRSQFVDAWRSFVIQMLGSRGRIQPMEPGE